ncbi:MAG: DUF2924 domain-containing protein [Acidobacteriota bacterium]
MQAIALADLDALSGKALKEAWADAYGHPPPKRSGRSLLIASLAYRIQEQANGGPSPATRRRLTTIATALERDPTYTPLSELRITFELRIKPGTRLIRRWKGDVHQVTVLDHGLDYRGCHYRSLSEIAREITGTRWSGPLFFGLRKNGISKEVRPADG